MTATWPARGARLVGRLVTRAYPAAVRPARAEVVAFVDDALEGAWHDRGVRGLTVVLMRLVRDVVAAWWRGPSLPITAGAPRPKPPRHSRQAGALLSDAASDLRYALRRLRAAPGFTVIALAMLALGIGSTTAIFAVLDDVLIRPLPYASPDRLVAIQEHVPKFAAIAPELPVAEYDFVRWRTDSRAFDGLALVGAGGGVLRTGGDPRFVYSSLVSANFFSILGLRAELGRLFEDRDEQPGHDHVIVLSHALWAGRFGALADIIGQHLDIDATSYEVIGVLPAGVTVPRQGQLDTMPFGDSAADFWQPFTIRQQDLALMSEFDFGCVGKLKAGVTVAQARADLERIEAGIAQSAGPTEALHAIVRPLQTQTGSRAHDGLVMLLAAVGTVLLIVCVNLSNLLLTKSLGRGREFAVRAAVGASVGRLTRQLLTEVLLLALAGSAVGLLAARWAVSAVLLTAPLGLPHLRPIGLDTPAWLFATTTTLLTALTIGILPARRLARQTARAALGGGTRAVGDGVAGTHVAAVLVAVEVALATSSLVVTALLLGSFVRLVRVDTGVAADHLVTTQAAVPGSTDDMRVAFDRRLLEAIRALPGVTAVGLTNKLPLTGEGSNTGLHAPDGAMGPTDWPVVDYRSVSAGYFEAVGIRLVKGRLFGDADGTHRVAVISARTAERVWPGRDPLGHTFQLSGRSDPFEVVGVVSDVHGASLQKAPSPTVYLPFWQQVRTPAVLAVRTAGDPAVVESALVVTLRRLEPGVPAPVIRTMDTIIDQSLAQRRFQLQVVLFFAVVGILLAFLGVYGVVAQSVVQRAREIGLRMALGADRADVHRLVLRQGLAPALVGLVAGLALALAGGRIVRDLLFGIAPTDVATYGLVAAALLVASVLACYIPARRAARVDPTDALRTEQA